MTQKTGLALCGGGARGAYQVGVIKAYVEHGGRVDVLSGSSVGAVNAAVLASAPTMAEGVDRLERLWLDEVPLLKLVLTFSNMLGLLEKVMELIATVAARSYPLAIQIANDLLNDGVATLEGLEELLDTYLDPTHLAKGPPLYVSEYESQGAVLDVAHAVLAEIGVLDTPCSRFVHLQSCTPRKQIETILASVAIPVLFSANKGGVRLADGGIGGWQTSQGHTPVDPLAREGCEVAIVSHLSADSTWGRDNYPDLTVLEITPSMNRSFLDLFERDPNVLESWLQQGYEDATRQLGRIREAVEVRNKLAESERAVADSEVAREQAEAERRDAMERLRR